MSNISSDSSFQEDETSSQMTPQGFDINSIHSNGSTLEADISHVINPGQASTPEGLFDLSLSDKYDIGDSNKL